MTQARPIKQERRWSARVHREVQVTVHLPGARPVRATAADISLGGVFVPHAECGAVGDVVTVGLSVGDGGHRTDYRFPATVVRAGRDGVALSFECFDRDTINSLRDALYLAEGSRAPSRPDVP